MLKINKKEEPEFFQSLKREKNLKIGEILILG